MPLMGVRRRENPQYNVVLGPCPGCDRWQLDYGDGCTSSWPTYQEFRDALEDVLAEHVEECPDLQLILAGGLFG